MPGALHMKDSETIELRNAVGILKLLSFWLRYMIRIRCGYAMDMIEILHGYRCDAIDNKAPKT